MDKETIIALAADIVSAHVSYNNVATAEVPKLIKSVYAALVGVSDPVEIVEVKRVPAVSVRASIKPDSITCLDCGVKMKMLKRHLMTDHGLSPQDYRARWGLNADYPLVAPEYAERRKVLAVQIGLGRKAGVGGKPGRPRKVPMA